MNGFLVLLLYVLVGLLAVALFARVEAEHQRNGDIDPDLLKAWDEAIHLTRKDYDR